MENLLQNFASWLWIVLGVYGFFGLRKWNKRFSELYDELKEEVERLTFEGNFCEIAQCKEVKCPYDTNCSQKKVWERLKQYEDSGYPRRLRQICTKF